jgi:hypothetical protein
MTQIDKEMWLIISIGLAIIYGRMAIPAIVVGCACLVIGAEMVFS